MSIRARAGALARGSARNPDPAVGCVRSACGPPEFGVGRRRATEGARTKMRNYVDGGEAIVEAFRKLKVDYIMSSPGSEWSPVWEALTRQTVEKRPGPKFIESWHETLAVNMASGYTAITGRPQAVLLHAAVGLLQGAM